MVADGTDQELLVSFDFGATGNSNAPEWSPDGASMAFHREVGGQPADLHLRPRGPPPESTDLARAGTRIPAGRPMAGTWCSCPTGRARRQLFVLDTETGRIRQIMTPGAASCRPGRARWADPVATLSLAERDNA